MMRVSTTVSGKILIEIEDTVYDASQISAGIDVRWPLPAGDPFMQIWEELTSLPLGDIQALPGAKFSPEDLRNPIRTPNKILGAMANYKRPDGSVADTSIRQYGFFPKANSSMISPSEGIVKHPEMETLHEPELSIVIGQTIKNANRIQAATAITAACGSLDMTGRGDWLWSHRKSVDSYGVFDPWLTPIKGWGSASDLENLNISLHVNEELRQTGTTANLVEGPIDLVVMASKYFTLYPGDIIMTGTPSGLGPVVPGDKVRMTLERIADFEVSVR